YALTFWAKSENYTGSFMIGTVYAESGVYDADTNGWDYIGSYLNEGICNTSPYFKNLTLTAEDGWVKYSSFITIPLDDVVEFRFDFRLCGTGTVWVDDVNIELVAPATSGFVKNGGLEEGLWANLPGMELDTTVAHSGQNSMKITVGNGEGGLTFNSEGNFIPGLVGGSSLDFASKSYLLTFWAKSDDFVGAFQCTKMYGDSFGEKPAAGQYWDYESGGPVYLGGTSPYMVHTKLTTDDGWVKYSTLLDIPFDNMSQLYFDIRVCGSGTIWIDDVDIEEISTKTIIPYGGMTGWEHWPSQATLIRSTFENSEKHNVFFGTKYDSGDYDYRCQAIKMEPNGAETTQMVQEVTLDKPINMQSDRYAITVYAKTDDFDGVLWFDGKMVEVDNTSGWAGGGSWDRTYLIGSANEYGYITEKLGNTGWTKYSVHLDIPYDNVTKIRMSLRSYGTGTIYLGYVNLEKIDPEPVIVPVKGDINGDGYVKSDDLVMLKSYLLGASTLTLEDKLVADANSDNTISILDIVRIKRICAAQYS
ncbi:MAG: dockerin type I repeat-containing protein, partial [Acutalibacteraceae bacterium]